MYYKSTEAPKFGICCISACSNASNRWQNKNVFLYVRIKSPTSIASVSKDKGRAVIKNLTASVTGKESKKSTASRLFVAHVPGITALAS